MVLIFVGVIVAFLLFYYDVDWGGFGDWIRENWWIIFLFGLLVLLAYRAFQGITTGSQVQEVTVRGSGGGNGGGGFIGSIAGRGSTWMVLIYGVVIIAILVLVLLILGELNVLSGSLERWADRLNPFNWFDYIPSGGVVYR